MMEQKGITVRARLVAQSTDGAYTSFVFHVLDKNDYVMCTRMPNWRGVDPQTMQEGFLRYKYVVGGRDTYFDTTEQKFKAYQYTDTYFLDFVPITHVLANGKVVAKNELIIS